MGKFITEVDEHWILPAAVLPTLGQQRELRMLGRAVPSPSPVRLISDSGSKRSTLIPELIRQFQPAAAGDAHVMTSVGSREVQMFWIRLEFPGTSLRPVSEAVVARLELPSPLAGFHGVIGRDLLRRWNRLVYEGRRGRLTLRDEPPGFFGWLR